VGGWLVAAFLVVPIVEIYVIIQVGEWIGPWPTVALLVAESLFGAWLIKHEGRRAWRLLRQAVGSGQLPSRELADAGLVLVGGTLLLTPGFVTDVAGFFFVLPVTRPIARRLLLAYLGQRATVAVARFGPVSRGGPTGSGTADGRVVPGEVVRDQPGTAGEPRAGNPGEGPDNRGPGRITGGK
jgi:UPF0716 protein FxsA